MQKLQCVKCSKYFRSFAKIKAHKAGTLGEGCSGEEKKPIIKVPEPVDDATNPWSYNLSVPEIPSQPANIESDGDCPKENDISNDSSESKDDSLDVDEEKKLDTVSDIVGEEKKLDDAVRDTETVSSNIKEEIKDVKEMVVQSVKIKEEPKDIDDIKIKEEPLDADAMSIKKELYADGIYKAAPIVLDSDSDEFEPESDESAPSDDDVETHLGLMRKNLNTDKPRKRKRKKVIPENATVIYMRNSAGVMVKKYNVHKESTRWVPPHPWVPYKTQVTVEQVCQYLEMVDYPIVMNEDLKKRFQDKQVFEDFATPLFRKVNPDAHPLTLKTLVKAKWFEVMNTNTEESKEENEDLNLNVDVKPSSNERKPILKKIKLNWTY